MVFNTNSQQSPQNSPWWKREKRDSLGARINEIQKTNDPTTYADEVLTGSKILLVLLLIFTGVLGAVSYYRNFAISFPWEVALAMALILTAVIEWGKNKCATWAVRIPFFQGWMYVGRTPANTFIFGGLVLVALATFIMSAYNSTKGGEQLTRMLSQEKNYTAFQPNTADIDAQLAALDAADAEASTMKTKSGKVNWNGRQIKQNNSLTRATLQDQRKAAIDQQRKDWESLDAKKEGNTYFAARVVLASGGWVELLQLLLIFIRVACEKNLDSRQSPTPAQRAQVNGYQHNSGPQQQPVQVENAFRPIGFNLDENGNVKSAAITEDVVMGAVPQEAPTVAQIEKPVAQFPQHYSTMGADQVLALLKQNLQREIPNLAAGNGNPASVSSRINRHLDEAYSLMSQADFLPTRQVASQVYLYLAEKAFPTLYERGWHYDREQAFCRRLLALIGSTRAGEGA